MPIYVCKYCYYGRGLSQKTGAVRIALPSGFSVCFGTAGSRIDPESGQTNGLVLKQWFPIRFKAPTPSASKIRSRTPCTN